MRKLTLEIVVEVPHGTPDAAVEEALNGALNEPPCDWGVWTVGAARITLAEDVPAEENE